MRGAAIKPAVPGWQLWDGVKQHPSVVVLVVLVVVFSLLFPDRFLTPINLTAALRQFVTLMLFAIGPSMVMVIGSLDLSYVGIWMLGSVLLWLLAPSLGIAALLVFPVLGLASGALAGFLHIRFRIPSFIVTLSLLMIYWGLTAILAGGYPRTVQGFGFITARLFPRIPTPFILSLPIIFAAWFIMKRTRIGTYFCAIGSNEEGAQLAGIDVKRYKWLAFALSGLFTGIGCIILFQHLGGSVPVEFNLNNLVYPLVAIVLGGTPLTGGSGGPHRTVVGALIFTALQRGLHLSRMRPELIDLTVGVVLIIAIIIGSRGTHGKEVNVT